MVPCGWLLSTCAGWMLTWFCPAQPWMVSMFWPTRSGSASPATTLTVTGWFSGWEVPAAGVVPATAPICGSLATPTGLVAAATVSPALRSSALAWSTLSPGGSAGW